MTSKLIKTRVEKMTQIIRIGLFGSLVFLLIGQSSVVAQQSSDDVVSQQTLDEVRKTEKEVNKPVRIQQADASDKEMTIEVQPNIIEMPGGEAGTKVAKVQMRRTRVRNTELRELNLLYNAVSIERIYEAVIPVNALAKVPGDELISKKKKNGKLEGKRILRKKDGEFFESNGLSADGSGKISTDRRVKVRKKKQNKAEGGQQIKSVALAESQEGISEENIGVVSDIFIISFKDYKDGNGQIVNIDIDAAVRAYSALSVVVSATKN